MLAQFRARYGDDVTKRDIFDYAYGLLHHPQYRERYAENLKRELPRVPLLPSRADYDAVRATGAALAALHLGYETGPEYKLTWRFNNDVPMNWRVAKMKLTPDKRAVVYNEWLTLEGVPPEAFAYRLGNRSALEWVIDQYQVSADGRSGITSDPNREGSDEERQYIARPVGRVTHVSVETVRLVRATASATSVSSCCCGGGCAVATRGHSGMVGQPAVGVERRPQRRRLGQASRRGEKTRPRHTRRTYPPTYTGSAWVVVLRRPRRVRDDPRGFDPRRPRSATSQADSV